ncbi:MAG: hypothetical protein U0804_17080 [Gemmataceae bacterium]
MLDVLSMGAASLRLGVEYLKLIAFVKRRGNLPGVGRAGRFHVVDVSRLAELREVLVREGLIPGDGADRLVPAGAGAELAESL